MYLHMSCRDERQHVCGRTNCNTIKVLNSQVAIARRHTFSGPGELLVIAVEAHPTKSH